MNPQGRSSNEHLGDTVRNLVECLVKTCDMQTFLKASETSLLFLGCHANVRLNGHNPKFEKIVVQREKNIYFKCSKGVMPVYIFDCHKQKRFIFSK